MMFRDEQGPIQAFNWGKFTIRGRIHGKDIRLIGAAWASFIAKKDVFEEYCLSSRPTRSFTALWLTVISERNCAGLRPGSATATAIVVLCASKPTYKSNSLSKSCLGYTGISSATVLAVFDFSTPASSMWLCHVCEQRLR